MLGKLACGGSWAAVQEGPGILGPSSGEGEAAGFGGVIESPGLKVRQWLAVVTELDGEPEVCRGLDNCQICWREGFHPGILSGVSYG